MSAAEAQHTYRFQGQYTLFNRIPVYLGPDQTVYTDPLWAKDLELHLEYLPGFALCCPVPPFAQRPDSAQVVRGLAAGRVTALRQDRGPVSILRNLWPNFQAVRRALRFTDIAHSGGAGWAFPPTFFLLPLHLVKPFAWVIVIESAFWMAPRSGSVRLREKLRQGLYLRLLKWALKRASARIFTQSGYQALFGFSQANSQVMPAVWVDGDQILTPDTQRQRLADLPGDTVRFIFPARLVAEKGIDTVLEAITALDRLHDPKTHPGVVVDIIGEGPLTSRISEFIGSRTGSVQARLQDPVPYGPVFFRKLQEYHAMVLANRFDEQPRVIFDSFSQGVPVISSATQGVLDIVAPEETALVFPVNDAEAMARNMLRFATDRTLQAEMSEAALAAGRGHTHRRMHVARAAYLAGIFPKSFEAACPNMDKKQFEQRHPDAD